MAKIPATFNAEGKPICGAQSKRTGQPCKSKPCEGRLRCRMHGGTVKLGAQKALKEGIYSKFLSPEEKDMYIEMCMGTVDDELRLSKIRLARALRAEAEATDLDLDSRKETPILNKDGFPIPGEFVVERTYKKRDFSAIIDRTLGRIESIEKTRAELSERTAANGALATTPIGGITITVQSGERKV